MPSERPIVGAIEAGGTKFVVAVGSGPNEELLARAQFPTGDDPQKLLSEVIDWLLDAERKHGKLAALGVASFGPVDLDRSSPTYGFITTTPKRGWKNTDIVGPFRAAFPKRPIGFDTDVNGAALGEGRWGAARGIEGCGVEGVGLEDFVYVTVGTGIGGGGVVRGKLMHGLVHPEMGHIPMPVLEDDRFRGACAIHGRCWEGLCAGPAIEERAGKPAAELAADDPTWDLTARYMAHAFATLTYVLSPRRIIFGGSVRKGGNLGEAAFFAKTRTHLLDALAGYIDSPLLTPTGVEHYLVPPLLGDDAGVCGAIALAHDAWRDELRAKSNND
jgi:fructokinase